MLIAFVPPSRLRAAKVGLAIAGAAVAVGIAIVRFRSIICLAVPLAVGVMALLVAIRRMSSRLDAEAKHQIMWWTFVSLALHLAAGLIITNTSLALYFGPDAFIYHQGASEIVRHWKMDFPFPNFIPGGKEGFYYVLASLYWLLGVSTAAGLALNSILSASLVPLLYDTTERLFGPAAARRVPPLAVLLPGVFIWSTQLLKEACVLFLVATSINCAVRLSQRISIRPVLILTVALASTMTFRAQFGFVLTAGVLLGLALGRRQLVGGLTTAIGALSILSVLVAAVGLGYAGFRASIDTDLENAQVMRSALATSVDSGFAADSDISTTAGALSYLPRGIAAMLLGPFPWELRNIRQLPALIDVLVWWSLLPSLFRVRLSGRPGGIRSLAVMALPAIAATILLSLAIGNFGTVVRERTQIVIMVLPIIALGLSQRRPESRRAQPPLDASPEPAMAA